MSLGAMGTSEHRNDSAAGPTLVRSPGPVLMSRCLALGSSESSFLDPAAQLQIGATASNVGD